MKELAQYRPSRTHPLEGVSPDNPLWPKYVAYWERRYGELAGNPGLKGPLKWEPYEALTDQFGRARRFQGSATQTMRHEVLATPEERVWLRGMKNPRVDENMCLAREGSTKRYFVDQMAVEQATLGPGQKPVVHSFSTKQHGFSGKTPKEAREQLRTDIAEAKAKYAGTVEIRRPGHPLFGRKVVVSRVHIIYDGRNLLLKVKEALLGEARTRGVELHFHVE